MENEVGKPKIKVTVQLEQQNNQSEITGEIFKMYYLCKSGFKPVRHPIRKGSKLLFP